MTTGPFSSAVQGILLSESYVLDVRAQPSRVTFLMEFALTEGHPLFQTPPQDSYMCYRSGTLTLNGVSRLMWTDQGAPPAYDANDERDYGTIDSWNESTGALTIYGDFGRIEASFRGATATFRSQ